MPRFKIGIIARITFEERHEVYFVADTLEHAQRNAVRAVEGGMFHPVRTSHAEVVEREADVGVWDADDEYHLVATPAVATDR
jgi:hypothetical protein